MRKALYLLFALALVLVVGSPVFADTFDWTYTSSTDNGSGTLTTSAFSGGQATILSFNGTWDGRSITGTLPSGTCCSSPSNDNTLYYPGTPYLDLSGVGFSFFVGLLDVNLFYEGGYEVDTSSVFGLPILTSQNGSFSVTDVTEAPEPATVGLLGCGLLALLLLRKLA
jgi:hypothetical protein